MSNLVKDLIPKCFFFFLVCEMRFPIENFSSESFTQGKKDPFTHRMIYILGILSVFIFSRDHEYGVQIWIYSSQKSGNYVDRTDFDPFNGL